MDQDVAQVLFPFKAIYRLNVILFKYKDFIKEILKFIWRCKEIRVTKKFCKTGLSGKVKR